MLHFYVRACNLALAVIMQGGMINTQSGSAQGGNYLKVDEHVLGWSYCRAEHTQEVVISGLIDNHQGHYLNRFFMFMQH